MLSSICSEVVEGHFRVDSKSRIEPFCGDMQKPPYSSYSCFFAPRLLSAHVISLHLLRVSALGSVLRPARPETRTGRCNGAGCSGKVWRSKPGAPFLGREMPPPASPGEAPRSRATSRAKLYRKNRRWWPGQGSMFAPESGDSTVTKNVTS